MTILKNRFGDPVAVSSPVRANKVSIDMREVDIVVGAKIKYRGDKVPFVTRFTREKGEKNGGTHLLPSFDLKDVNNDHGRNWRDIPCPNDIIFEVIKVETGRTRKPRMKKDGTPGKAGALPDLVVIRSDHFQDTAFGLRKEDLIAKFDRHFVPDAYNPEDLTKDEIAEAALQVSSWRDEVSNDGW